MARKKMTLADREVAAMTPGIRARYTEIMREAGGNAEALGFAAHSAARSAAELLEVVDQLDPIEDIRELLAAKRAIAAELRNVRYHALKLLPAEERRLRENTGGRERGDQNSLHRPRGRPNAMPTQEVDETEAAWDAFFDGENVVRMR